MRTNPSRRPGEPSPRWTKEFYDTAVRATGYTIRPEIFDQLLLTAYQSGRSASDAAHFIAQHGRSVIGRAGGKPVYGSYYTTAENFDEVADALWGVFDERTEAIKAREREAKRVAQSAATKKRWEQAALERSRTRADTACRLSPEDLVESAHTPEPYVPSPRLLELNPSSSDRQRRLFGAALAVKRGADPRGFGPDVLRLARELPEETLRAFARR